MKTVLIDPVTRIEGHLAVKVEVNNGKVEKAFCSGEMFRGFENILRGRDPLDAHQITQRICGVCPISHGITSIRAQDQAYKITPPPNGRLLRNLIQAANYIQSHIIHFYHLCALDFVDIAAIGNYTGKDESLTYLRDWVKFQLASNSTAPAAPFLPRYNTKYIEDHDLNMIAIKHYLEALEMRRLAHHACAIFGGKVPHPTALVPGGVTEKAAPDKIARYRSVLAKLKKFVNDAYIPDVLEVAKKFPEYFTIGKGCGNYMAYGAFPESNDDSVKVFPSGVILKGKLETFSAERIREDVGHSKFSSPTGLHPSKGQTTAAPDGKTDAYSWLKAPRYDGLPMEVGPLARVLVAYEGKVHPQLNQTIDELLKGLNLGPEVLNSVLGRHAARALETKIIIDRAFAWLDQLVPGDPTCTPFTPPDSSEGMGLWEAPRGALGHWITIRGGRIDNYQCVVPSTWNSSPRCDKNIPGPMEQALENTPVADPENPVEAARVVRSFDPCLACAVH